MQETVPPHGYLVQVGPDGPLVPRPIFMQALAEQIEQWTSVLLHLVKEHPEDEACNEEIEIKMWRHWLALGSHLDALL